MLVIVIIVVVYIVVVYIVVVYIVVVYIVIISFYSYVSTNLLEFIYHVYMFMINIVIINKLNKDERTDEVSGNLPMVFEPGELPNLRYPPFHLIRFKLHP